MSAKLIVTMLDGSTEEHYLSRSDLEGKGGDYRYSVRDGVLFVHKHHEGTTAYPMTSVLRWDVKL